MTQLTPLSTFAEMSRVARVAHLATGNGVMPDLNAVDAFLEQIGVDRKVGEVSLKDIIACATFDAIHFGGSPTPAQFALCESYWNYDIMLILFKFAELQARSGLYEALRSRTTKALRAIAEMSTSNGRSTQIYVMRDGNILTDGDAAPIVSSVCMSELALVDHATRMSGAVRYRAGEYVVANNVWAAYPRAEDIGSVELKSWR